MTPLQYQKHLQLLEAWRLMVAGCADVTNAAYQVGTTPGATFSPVIPRRQESAVGIDLGLRGDDAN